MRVFCPNCKKYIEIKEINQACEQCKSDEFKKQIIEIYEQTKKDLKERKNIIIKSKKETLRKFIIDREDEYLCFGKIKQIINQRNQIIKSIENEHALVMRIWEYNDIEDLKKDLELQKTKIESKLNKVINKVIMCIQCHLKQMCVMF